MKVLQLIDSLNAGGAERVAVNYANTLSSKIDASFICATRKEGVLKDDIDSEVGYLFLNRKKAIDIKAIKRLNKYVKEYEIDIIHAHSSSFFFATIIKLINKKVKIVWHDHFGNRPNSSQKSKQILRLCSFNFSTIIAVNNNLKAWSESYLKTKHVVYIQNFAVSDKSKAITKLKGKNGKRIVCLANLRQEKDHVNLITAFKDVVNVFPDWTLHCVGKDYNDSYSKEIKQTIKALSLNNDVYLHGEKSDVSHILNQCEIGVLSSKYEGLPIALLEYGLANLAVVATKVGECEYVIGTSDYGILVESKNSDELSKAIILLIKDINKRSQMSKTFHNKIIDEYSSKVVMEKVLNIYSNLG